MGKGTRYSDEFKQEAVNQVVVHGYSVADVSQRLGISNKGLYDNKILVPIWIIFPIFRVHRHAKSI